MNLLQLKFTYKVQVLQYTLVLCFLFAWQINATIAQIGIIDYKGTKRNVDTSKWSFGNPNINNIFNKNSGNVGIGNINPLYKLDVTGKLRVTDSAIVNALRILNTATGAATDSLLTWEASTGNTRRLRVADLPILGDVTGTLGASTVSRLQGRPMSATAPTAGQILKWNAGTTQWEPSTDAAASNWLLTGNSNATATNFLGTTNDIKMSIASNNTTMLELGRRQTLGLVNNTGNLFPYNQPDNSTIYIKGAGGVSALEFEASGASFYKPVFFTDASGNFQMRGSSAATDFFELGSAGASNAGRLEFTIGDDGDEPIIFRKYNYSPVGYVELMRLQGTGLNNTVRAGINVNGVTPNSTLQIQGSIAPAITTISAATTLSDIHHTIILTNNSTITLPGANTCAGRLYIIKKTNNGNATISTYVPTNGVGTSTTIAQGVTWLQSDGTNWQRLL